jgi:hypothetical protein
MNTCVCNKLAVTCCAEQMCGSAEVVSTPCGTDVHRVALTIDLCILEQESHMQRYMNVKWGIKSTKHGIFGRNACLFTCATEAFIACEGNVATY